MLMMQSIPNVVGERSKRVTNAGLGNYQYQIEPHNYYVKDYFLAKSLLYVLRYINDDILFHVAVDEAALKCKIPRTDIIEHVHKIKSLK